MRKLRLIAAEVNLPKTKFNPWFSIWPLIWLPVLFSFAIWMLDCSLTLNFPLVSQFGCPSASSQNQLHSSCKNQFLGTEGWFWSRKEWNMKFSRIGSILREIDTWCFTELQILRVKSFNAQVPTSCSTMCWWYTDEQGLNGDNCMMLLES